MPKLAKKAFTWEKSYPKGVIWDAPLPNITLLDMLDETVKNFGERPAFTFIESTLFQASRTLTWNEIDEEVNRFAKGLQDLGIKKGDKVGICLPNCPLYLIAYYGILRAGATVVNYSPLADPEKTIKQINDSATRMIITADLRATYNICSAGLKKSSLEKLIIANFAKEVPAEKETLMNTLGMTKRIFFPSYDKDKILKLDDVLNNDARPKKIKLDPDKDIALIQYTGGTTGDPKGAMLTHRNVAANILQIEHWIQGIENGKEKMVGVLPFFHVFAMTAVMNLAVRKAMEIVAIPRFNLAQTMQLLNDHKPTVFPGVPKIFSSISNHPKLNDYNLTSIKYCVAGGDKLPLSVRQDFERKTGCVLVEGYGLSETSPVLTVNPLEGKPRDGSAGLPLPGTDIKLYNKETGEEITNTDEPGEISAKGPQVMPNYLNKEKQRSEFFRGDYFRTGDMGKFDKDGYLYIVDRIKEMAIINGFNVYPSAVENAIEMHPDVEECIVICDNRNPAKGDILMAFVKPKDGRKITSTKLREFLQDKLSRYEIPKEVIIRNEPLPRTMIGKKSRKDLRDQELGPH